LIEVLISIGVITVGLLGVAAMLPVGRYHIQEIEKLQQSAACGRASLAEVDLRNMAALCEPATVTQPGQPAPAEMGRFVRWDVAANQHAVYPWAAFTGPPQNAWYVEGLRDWAPLTPMPPYPAPCSVMLDPIGYAKMGPEREYFPYVASSLRPDGSSNPASATLHLLTNTNCPHYVRLPRVTFRMSAPQWVSNPPNPPVPAPFFPMPFALADRLFTWPDDVAIPVSGDMMERPQQMFLCSDGQGHALPGNVPSGVLPLYGQCQGDYSWMVMITPDPAERFYPAAQQKHLSISIVVFHKRDLATTAAAPPSERTVCANMVGEGFRGGEVKLTTAIDPAYLEVKPGQYLLLCGVDNQRIPIYQWYRVVAVDPDIEPDINPNSPGPPRWRRLVMLSGPDWLTPPTGGPYGNHWCDKQRDPNNANAFIAAPFDLDGDGKPADAVAVLADGVIGVFTQTITLP